MRDILLFWAETEIDGFRCDMVGMVPEEFWNWVIPSIKYKYPDLLFIGEIYEKHRYSRYLDYCKFDYLYDKVGLYDTFKEIFSSKLSLNAITENWQSLGKYEDSFLNFMENHDEVRVASDFYLKDAKRAIPAVATGILLNKAPYLIYFGQELGEKGMDAEGYSNIDGKTSIFDYWSVPSVRNWLMTGGKPELREKYKQIISIATRERAISVGKRFDLKYANQESQCDTVFPFARKSEDELLLIFSNFSTEKCNPKINIPSEMFEFFEMKPNIEYSATELLSGNTSLMLLSSNQPLEVELSDNEVKIFKLLL
jgi:glycosidase